MNKFKFILSFILLLIGCICYSGAVFYQIEDGNIVYIYTNDVSVGLINNNITTNKLSVTCTNENGIITFRLFDSDIITNAYVDVTNLVDVYPYTSTNNPLGAKTNISEIIIVTPEELENRWQNNKHPMLKTIENLYINFLTNDWTICLRTNSLIPPDYTITVTNASEITNVTYLLQLRSINKEEYYKMAGEFDRFKTTITSYGGIMSKVINH